MAKRSRAAGAPAWLVTFADLMSLLVCFFVLIISFSVPDIEKLRIAAGSIRDAFGIQRRVVVTGVVELDGSPLYKFAQDLQPWQIEDIVGPVPEDSVDISRPVIRRYEWQDPFAEDREPHEDPDTEEGRFSRIEAELLQALALNPALPRLPTLGLVGKRLAEETAEELVVERRAVAAHADILELLGADEHHRRRHFLGHLRECLAGLLETGDAVVGGCSGGKAEQQHGHYEPRARPGPERI